MIIIDKWNDIGLYFSIRIGSVDISHTTVELETPFNAVAAISDAFIAVSFQILMFIDMIYLLLTSCSIY